MTSEELPPPRLRIGATLRTADGRELQPVRWRSALQKELTLATEDPSYADALAALAHEVLGAEPEGAVADRLVALAAYLPVIDPIAPALFGETASCDPRIRDLCAGLSRVTYTRPPTAASGPVAVIHSDHGGGTRTAAQALVAALGELGQAAQAVDVSAVPGRVDPLRVAFGVGEHVLWNKLVADRGDPDALQAYTQHLPRISDFVPGNTLAALRAFLAPMRPRVIVSCVSGYPKLVQLAQLGVPVVICHTDFQLNPKLIGRQIHPYFATSFANGLSLLDRASPRRLAVWLASRDPEAEAALSPAARALVRVVGHPAARVSKTPPEQIRGALGLHPGERLILVGMGLDGSGVGADALCEAVRRLAARLTASALILVVTGRASRGHRLFRDLESPVHPVRIRVVSRLTPGAWRDALVLCSGRDAHPGLCIAKPGGATIAEVMAAGARMLGVGGFTWERVNLDHAIAAGVAAAASPEELPEAALALLDRPPPPVPPPPDWPARIAEALHDLNVTPEAGQGTANLFS
ncbi:hypothetical protein [Arhodomonas sp. AD133]|uniref:hypothetical protein n=1 Tax=Arhodomonas sp. AD133 TaxID=3415009 RepID=UPI003EBB5EAF